MKGLRYDAVSYVLKNGNSFHKLKLAQILGREEDYPPLVEELESLQNEDGGWPWLLDPGNPSGVSDTAKVLELLSNVGVESTETIEKAVSFLLSKQNDDGGWSESPDLEGVVPKEWTWVSTKHSGYQTADALNALHEAGYSGAEVERALDFLRVSQNEDGGWSSHVGPESSARTDTATTDHIVIAFLSHGESRESQVIRRAEMMLIDRRADLDSPIDATAALSVLLALGYPQENEHVSEFVCCLVEAQRPDGGWNWFEDLPSNPFQTVDSLEQLVKFVDIRKTG